MGAGRFGCPKTVDVELIDGAARMLDGTESVLNILGLAALRLLHPYRGGGAPGRPARRNFRLGGLCAYRIALVRPLSRPFPPLGQPALSALLRHSPQTAIDDRPRPEGDPQVRRDERLGSAESGLWLKAQEAPRAAAFCAPLNRA